MSRNPGLKLQSAMEYLMTYGWTILIIAVVLGTLFQLGVFNGQNYGQRASAGSCQILRSAASVSLVGECVGQLPGSVALLPNPSCSFERSIVVSYSPGLSLAGKSSMSISLWAYPYPGYASGENLIQQSAAYGVLLSSSGNVIIDFFTPAEHFVTTNLQLPANLWSNLIVTYDGSNAKVYYNGALSSTSSFGGGIAPGTNTVYLGGPTCGDYAGELANYQLYDTALNANEVQYLYVQGIGAAPVIPQNTVGWWPLNTNGNDYSGRNNNGQVQAGVTFTNQWISGYNGH
jgi:hypothetical protein